MRTLRLLIIYILLWGAPSGLQAYRFIHHSNETQGVNISVPQDWLAKSFTRAQKEFFPTERQGAFLELSLIEPTQDDYSTTNPEFFLLDLVYSLQENKSVSEIKEEAFKLSGLDAYKIEFDIKTSEGQFHSLMIFTGANEKIYLLQFQSFADDYSAFKSVLFEEIIPTYEIMIIGEPEIRYAYYDHDSLNFSLYYPAKWRLINYNVSAEPTIIYSSGASGFNVMGRSSDFRPSIRALGYDIPVAIAPTKSAMISIKVIPIPTKVDTPAYAIEWYAKGVQKSAKKLKGYRHLRQFQSKISGRLAMEYVYLYKETDEDEEKEYLVKYYITFGNNQIYTIVYAAPDSIYSEYFKEVERIVRHFRIH